MKPALLPGTLKYLLIIQPSKPTLRHLVHTGCQAYWYPCRQLLYHKPLWETRMFHPCLTLKFLLTTQSQQYRLHLYSICYTLNAARLNFQQKLQKMKMKRHSKSRTQTAVTGNFKIITHKINSLDNLSVISSYVDSCGDDSH